MFFIKCGCSCNLAYCYIVSLCTKIATINTLVYTEEEKECVYLQGNVEYCAKKMCITSLVTASSHRTFQCISEIVTMIIPRDS